MANTIKKILVANRGEIALRLMRTIREMDRISVAVYSDPDVSLPFASYADEAYALRGSEARGTYLDIEKIISIAKRCRADAIHPGYGFLSENPDFAEAAEKAGIIFIGPDHKSIAAMGDKTEARRIVSQRGVPVVPGTPDAIADDQEAIDAAREIGYPLLVKAAAGGGGKGMRLVSDEIQLVQSVRSAQSEAASSFGDGRVFLEKYVANPRHVEFQILADSEGNTVHLFERECSIQRRHQKVVEETPSVLLDDDLRARMSRAAVDAAKSCGYTNAGTVEFIVGQDRKFYFLEMNTRLQVEHAITEMTTGLDLARLQIEIAEGRPLGFSQEEVKKNGHAIECRIYAEEVYNDFMPATGHLDVVRPPTGNWVRVDSGVVSGNEISVYYDPMIAKLVVWERTRDLAIQKMIRALDDYVLIGVETTIPFCRSVMTSEEFVSGEYSTHFVEKVWKPRSAESGSMMERNPELPAILASAGLAGVSTLHSPDAKSVEKKSRWKDGRFDT